MMQLDDVVSSTLDDPARMEEAMLRSIRWLDRCIAAHARKTEQNLFPIVQGGLDVRLRTISANGMKSHPLDHYIATERGHQLLFLGFRVDQKKHVWIRHW